MSKTPSPQNAPQSRPQPTGAERRRWPRANAELPIAITIGGATQQARVRDISRAGICFYLDRSLPLMTLLSVELDASALGAGRSLRGQGAVVRCAKISPHVSHYEVAVFFHDMADSDRATLDALVRARLPVA